VASVAVIARPLTANVGERAKQLGAVHLVKPVMADELLRTVAQFAPPAQPGAGD